MPRPHIKKGGIYMLKIYLFMLVVSFMCGIIVYLRVKKEVNKPLNARASILRILLVSIFIIPNIVMLLSYTFYHDAFMEGYRR